MATSDRKKGRTPRETALHLLRRIETGGAYADRILASREVGDLALLDRSFVRELVLGVLRWKLRLDHIIDRYYTGKPSSLKPAIRMILRLGLYQMMFLDAVPEWAAVNESVEMASRVSGRGAAGLVNALLRRFSREGEPPVPAGDPTEQISVEQSFPRWITQRWIDQFGQETAEAVMQASNEKHAVSIRANTRQTSVGSLISALADEGFEAVESEMPGYLVVPKATGLFDSSLFREGRFIAQDGAAAMAAILLDPKPGELVLDLCSAPGGKTTHCAELMNDSGRIDAVDRNRARLGLVHDAAERLSHRSITCIEGDAAMFGSDGEKWYDRILLDVPCTGTGVFSKRPDMKWRKNRRDLERIATLQFEMLVNAGRLLKPGGVLVYSTCSLEPEEDEVVVHRYLELTAEERGYDVAEMRDDRFKKYEREVGYLILPHEMHGAGAFAVKLKRG